MNGRVGRLIVEACVDSPGSAERAYVAGADRIELCAALDVGGTTPSMDDVAACVAVVDLPVHVMIRPRAGSFIYDASELSRMRQDIERARAAGAAAVVLGVLGPGGGIDVARTRALMESARPLPVTFHRAFDAVGDLAAALEDVIATGAARLLTSGGSATALDGVARLARLVASAGTRVEVMAGGAVRAPNVQRIIAETGVCAVHARCDPAEGDAFERLVVAVRALESDV